jgi:Secretion system C-terminal sorting domain
MKKIMFLIMFLSSLVFATSYTYIIDINKKEKVYIKYVSVNDNTHYEDGYLMSGKEMLDDCTANSEYEVHRSYFVFNYPSVPYGDIIKKITFNVVSSYPVGQLDCPGSQLGYSIVKPDIDILLSYTNIIQDFEFLRSGTVINNNNVESNDITSYYTNKYEDIVVGLIGTDDRYKLTEFTSAFLRVEVESPRPEKPVGLSLSPCCGSNSEVQLDWTANTEADMIDGSYKIYRSIVSGTGPAVNWTLVKTLDSPATTSWVDSESLTYLSSGPNWLHYKITAVDTDGYESLDSDSESINARLPKIYTEEEVEIANYVLGDNYPNPFNPTTQISYQIEKNGFVNLVVYNSIGQKVANLVSQKQSRGSYSVKFDATDLPSGVYVYKLQVNEFSSTKKMLLTK